MRGRTRALVLRLIAVRISECRIPWRWYVDVDRLRLRLWLVWINDRLLRLVRCVRVRIDDLGTSISNFAMPELDNPAVLENNIEV